MSQSEVIKILLKAKKPLSNREIDILTGKTTASISTSALRKSREISYIIANNMNNNSMVKYYLTAKQKREYRKNGAR